MSSARKSIKPIPPSKKEKEKTDIIGAKPSKEYHTYKGKKYIVRNGKRGGKYILIDKAKVYLPKKKMVGGVVNLAAYGDLKLLYLDQQNNPYMISTSGEQVAQLPTPPDNTLPSKAVDVFVIENTANKETAEQANIPILFPFIEGQQADVNRINELIQNIVFYQNYEVFYTEWVVPDNTNVIIVGDIHGDIIGLKALFNFWIQNYYMDNNGRLSPNIRVVSTGDLIDYGSNSIDVLYAMVKLRELNPGQVMLLAGNHEGSVTKYCVEDLHGRPKLNDEFNRKNILLQRNEFERMQYLTSLTSKIGPSLLSLRFQGDKYRMCMMHGMYPGLPLNNNQLVWWPNTNNIPNISYKDLIELTQWNDVTFINEQGYTVPGRGFTRTNNRTIIRWCMNDLQNIMVNQGIKAFFRGHQDGCPTQTGNYDVSCMNAVAIAYQLVQPQPPTYINTQKVCREGTIQRNNSWCVKQMPEITEIPNTLEMIWNSVYTTSMASEKTFRANRNMSPTPVGGFILIHLQENQPIRRQGGSTKTKKQKKKQVGSDNGSTLNEQPVLSTSSSTSTSPMTLEEWNKLEAPYPTGDSCPIKPNKQGGKGGKGGKGRKGSKGGNV